MAIMGDTRPGRLTFCQARFTLWVSPNERKSPMYGRTEHRYYLRRLGDVNRELDCQREIVATLYHEVRNDLDSSIAYDALSQFGAARRAIAAAMQAVDKAVALLPAPVA